MCNSLLLYITLFIMGLSNGILRGRSVSVIDIQALFMLAWLNLLLGLGRLGRVRSWKQTVPFVLLCALVWELAAPMFKPGAVFDWWDFVAYQAGGLLWLGAERLRVNLSGTKTV